MVATVSLTEFIGVWMCGAIFGSILTIKTKRWFKRKFV